MAVIPAYIKAMQINIDGKVQGVGFRPFVYRLACELSLNGWVRNRSDGVVIHAEGPPDHLEDFLDLLPSRAPEVSVISRLESRPVPAANFKRFTIRSSSYLSGSITGISPDIGVCDKCLADMENQGHRLEYPLVNCTFCGPRFSIVGALPYDRSNTSMREFEMCDVCRHEYYDPLDRRFHAQPVACNGCGPVYKMETINEEKVAGSVTYISEITEGKEIIEKLCTILENGGVAVVKGTGGYNIICDATNDQAVRRVRDIKGREKKPFAVMFRNTGTVREHCIVSEKEREVLESWRKPVVLLAKIAPVVMFRNTGTVKEHCVVSENEREVLESRRKPVVLPAENAPVVMFRNTVTVKEHCVVSEKEREVLESRRKPVVLPAPVMPVSSAVGGPLDTIGAILPYMPFHHLLFANVKIDTLVYTSANISDLPIVAGDEKAGKLFLPAAGALVSYNREIINPVDDSVCRVTAGEAMVIRRARGYVPDAVKLPFEADGIFAAGADMKNVFAIGRDSRAILSQHNGDLDNYEVFCRYRQNIDKFSTLFSFNPRRVACDLHPYHYSTRFAERLAGETGSRLIRVQHHHAHIASCMAEHHLAEPVIGVCFDGTGYGDDGKIWGSEFMVCDYTFYRRHHHLDYIPLPGGDKAIREPWRIALGCLQITGHRDTGRWINTYLKDISVEKISAIEKMIKKGINTPFSCGAGRLFDAVAALTGICRISGYEGEAPMLLESICRQDIEDGYEFSSGLPAIIDQVMHDLREKTAPGIISARFHNGLALFVSETVARISELSGCRKVVLSGGVFQNSYLTGSIIRLLNQEKYEVFTGRTVPVNDGGVALGQLAVASFNK